MKNLSLLLNCILLVLVGWLYYKVYAGNTAPDRSVPAGAAGSAMPANGIVFINSDTLLDRYEFFNHLKDQLEQRQDSMDKVLRAQASLLDKEVSAYQDKGAGMTPEQRAREEERLMQKQQQIMQTKQRLVDDLQERESQMNDSIHNNLHRFLEKYNKDKNYLYIFGYQRGSGILLANDSLDITKEVLEGLNKQ